MYDGQCAKNIAYVWIRVYLTSVYLIRDLVSRTHLRKPSHSTKVKMFKQIQLLIIVGLKQGI